MTRAQRMLQLAIAIGIALLFAGCSLYEIRHRIQGDSMDQVWQSDSSQVAQRAVQSRVFDTTDRARTLEAVVAAFQDLGFQIEVLDEDLGIVSGKRFEERYRGRYNYDPLYHLYKDGDLLIFTKEHRTWGPFWHRSDLVRLTVTVRPRNETQFVVRASAQYALAPVDDPNVYLGFFQTLSKSMFVEEQLLH